MATRFCLNLQPTSTFCPKPSPSFPTAVHPVRPFFSTTTGGHRPPPQPFDTLIIRKIPRDLNTITKLSNHFEKFGSIVNLAVRYEGDPEGALVRFSATTEAKKAYECPEPILNNRFIRVYYQKSTLNLKIPPPEVTARPFPRSQDFHPHAHAQQSTDPSNVPLSQKSHTPVLSKDTAADQNKKPAVPKPSKDVALKKLELERRSQLLIKQQIDQQKLLLNKLEKGNKRLSKEEKAQILKTINSLSANIAKMKEAAQKAVESNHSEVESTSSTKLKQKAESLRKKAHMLGLISSPSQPASASAKKRVQPRGSAHDLRNKLDSKTRQLLVMNVANREAAVEYLESFGGLIGVEVSPASPADLVFTFKTRTNAERIVLSSPSLNGKPLIMKWYKPPSTMASQDPSRPVSRGKTCPDDFETLSSTPTPTTPNLMSLEPPETHLLDDDDEEEEEEASEARSWKR